MLLSHAVWAIKEYIWAHGPRNIFLIWLAISGPVIQIKLKHQLFIKRLYHKKDNNSLSTVSFFGRRPSGVMWSPPPHPSLPLPLLSLRFPPFLLPASKMRGLWLWSWGVGLCWNSGRRPWSATSGRWPTSRLACSRQSAARPLQLRARSPAQAQPKPHGHPALVPPACGSLRERQRENGAAVGREACSPGGHWPHCSGHRPALH